MDDIDQDKQNQYPNLYFREIIIIMTSFDMHLLINIGKSNIENLSLNTCSSIWFTLKVYVFSFFFISLNITKKCTKNLNIN